MKKIHKVAAIHDISGMGRCSMTVIIPIMSALGCQVCPLPTALFSSHPLFKDFYFYDFTQHMEEYFSSWQKNDATFDCVYSGFISSEKQIDIISQIIDKTKEKNATLIVVDPVMGDHGKVYRTYNDKMIQKMSELVKKADIVTPNLTETSILLNNSYNLDKVSLDYVKSSLYRLCELGPKYAVITGINTEDGNYINACYIKETGEYYIVPYEYVNAKYPGTGDLFTSLLTAYILNNKTLPQAMEFSSIFISSAVKQTYEDNTPPHEGVLIEKKIKELFKEITHYNYIKI